MGFAEDFEVLWEQEKKQLNSAVLVQEESEDGVSPEKLQQAYRTTARKWSDSLSAEYSLMKRMRRMEPELAERFQEKLDGFSFAREPAPQEPSLIPYLGVEALICLLGAGIGYLLASRSIIGRFLNAKIAAVLAAVILGVFAAGIIKEMWKNKKQEAWHKTGDGYRAQIEKLGRELLEICKCEKQRTDL
ncbi:MAG: hypothetical protein Q4E89_11685 [Eubacteriales bacterium]|nr:hypothetical protein [Eubacteriales bacterium]